MSQDATLCRSFVRQAQEALRQFPKIQHTWSIDEDQGHCVLEIPQACDHGFSVMVEVQPDEIVVRAGNAHTHIDLDADADTVAARALGLVCDLLSPAIRIRERLAAGKPYKWVREVCQDRHWVAQEWDGLIFFNYFGKRTERIYQNRILPAGGDATG